MSGRTLCGELTNHLNCRGNIGNGMPKMPVKDYDAAPGLIVP